MAAPSGEPQLTLKAAGGARRWGPAHFEAAPAAAPAAAAASSRTATTGTPWASAACKSCHNPQGCLTGMYTVSLGFCSLLCAQKKISLLVFVCATVAQVNAFSLLLLCLATWSMDGCMLAKGFDFA